jgi:ABC-type transporter Mla subunit MlaD
MTPVPNPAAVGGQAARMVRRRATTAAEQAIRVIPGLPALLEEAERLLLRASALLEAADEVRSAVAGVARDAGALVQAGAERLQLVDDAVARVETAVSAAYAETARVATVRAETEALMTDAGPLLADLAATVNRLEPTLRRLAPALSRLADSLGPEEAAALAEVGKQLPSLTDRLDGDIAPALGTLETVAPDVRELVDTSKQLNELLGHVPGMGRIRKKMEADQPDDQGRPEAQPPERDG